MTIQELIIENPEHIIMITSALAWLDEQEPKWNLDKPIDKEEFVKLLLEKAR